MPFITVDEERCDLCHWCAAACPADLISFPHDRSLPVPIDGAEESCCVCGHCVAACPNEALSHEQATPEQCLPIRDQWRVSPAQVAQLLRGRRSTRNFTREKVPRDVIAELLDVARFAPSGCNAQPVHWLVIHDTKQVRQIAELVAGGLRHLIEQNPPAPLCDVLCRLVNSWDEGVDTMTRGAPHLVMAHAMGADPLTTSACIIAQTYFELASSAHGLGACWMGLVDMTANTWPPLREFLALPDGHVVLASMALGYPEFPYVRIPPRRELRVTWR